MNSSEGMPISGIPEKANTKEDIPHQESGELRDLTPDEELELRRLVNRVMQGEAITGAKYKKKTTPERDIFARQDIESSGKKEVIDTPKERKLEDAA